MHLKKQKEKDRRRARKLADRAWEAADAGNLDLPEKIVRRAVAAPVDNPVLWVDQGVTFPSGATIVTLPSRPVTADVPPQTNLHPRTVTRRFDISRSVVKDLEHRLAGGLPRGATPEVSRRGTSDRCDH
jgi:hypothetical protein